MFKKNLLLCVFCVSLNIGSLAEELKTSVVWEKEYALTSPAQEELLICKNSDILYARINLEKRGLIIRRFNAAGKFLWENIFEEAEHIAVDGNVKGIVEDLAGNIYMGVNTPNNGLLFFKISPSGQLLFSKSFHQDFYNNRGAVLSKLIFHAEAIYALGQLGAHEVWLCKLTPAGSKILEIRYSAGKDFVEVTSALVNRKGELLVVLYSGGKFDKFGGGPSLLKVLRFNEDAKKLELVTSFKGKRGDICQLSAGQYVIGFDESPIAFQQRMRVKIFNESFEHKFEKELYENRIGSSMAYAHDYDEDSFIVCGVKEHKVIFIVINFAGEVVAEKIFPPDNVAGITECLAKDDIMVVLYGYQEFHPNQTPETTEKNKLVLYRIQ